MSHLAEMKDQIRGASVLHRKTSTSPSQDSAYHTWISIQPSPFQVSDSAPAPVGSPRSACINGQLPSNTCIEGGTGYGPSSLLARRLP